MRVVLVHGIGATGKVWGKTKEAISKHFPCSAITFKDRFGGPEAWALELGEFLKQFKKEPIILVAHSMGGLVARKYLVDNPYNNVAKLVLIGTPNLGSFPLIFNYLPLFFEILGSILALITENYWFFLIVLLAAGYDLYSYFRGVKLISRAVEAMKPNSAFLKDLNSKSLPDIIKYVAIISRPWYHLLGNGAASLDSQKLSEKCAPNFKELKYKEIKTDRPHFAEPGAKDAILAALR